MTKDEALSILTEHNIDFEVVAEYEGSFRIILRTDENESEENND